MLVRERVYGIRVRKVALPKDAVLAVAKSEISEGMLTVTVLRRRRMRQAGSVRKKGSFLSRGFALRSHVADLEWIQRWWKGREVLGQFRKEHIVRMEERVF